jgi:hypothetical protein
MNKLKFEGLNASGVELSNAANIAAFWQIYAYLACVLDIFCIFLHRSITIKAAYQYTTVRVLVVIRVLKLGKHWCRVYLT